MTRDVRQGGHENGHEPEKLLAQMKARQAPDDLAERIIANVTRVPQDGAVAPVTASPAQSGTRFRYWAVRAASLTVILASAYLLGAKLLSHTGQSDQTGPIVASVSPTGSLTGAERDPAAPANIAKLPERTEGATRAKYEPSQAHARVDNSSQSAPDTAPEGLLADNDPALQVAPAGPEVDLSVKEDVANAPAANSALAQGDTQFTPAGPEDDKSATSQGPSVFGPPAFGGYGITGGRPGGSNSPGNSPPPPSAPRPAMA